MREGGEWIGARSSAGSYKLDVRDETKCEVLCFGVKALKEFGSSYPLCRVGINDREGIEVGNSVRQRSAAYRSGPGSSGQCGRFMAATSGTLTSVLETTWQEARSNWDHIVQASGDREIPMNPRTREQLMCKGSIL